MAAFDADDPTRGLTFHRRRPANVDRDVQNLNKRVRRDYRLDHHGIVIHEHMGISLFSFRQTDGRMTHRPFPQGSAPCWILNRPSLAGLRLEIIFDRIFEDETQDRYRIESHWLLRPIQGANMTKDEFIHALTDAGLWNLCHLFEAGAETLVKIWKDTDDDYIFNDKPIQELFLLFRQCIQQLDDDNDLLLCADVISTLKRISSLDDISAPIARDILYFSEQFLGLENLEDLEIPVEILLVEDAISQVKKRLASFHQLGQDDLESGNLVAYFSDGRSHEPQALDSPTFVNLLLSNIQEYFDQPSKEARNQLLQAAPLLGRKPTFRVLAKLAKITPPIAIRGSFTVTFEKVGLHDISEATSELENPQFARAISLWCVDQLCEKADDNDTATLIGTCLVNPAINQTPRAESEDQKVAFTWIRVERMPTLQQERVSRDVTCWLKTIRKYWRDSFRFKFLFVNSRGLSGLQDSVGELHQQRMKSHGFSWNTSTRTISPPHSGCTFFCLTSWDRPNLHRFSTHEIEKFFHRNQFQFAFVGPKLFEIPIN